MRLRLFASAALFCAAACGAPSSTSAQHAGTPVPTRAAPRLSPPPSTPHDIALAWWDSSAHPALRGLQLPYAGFQALIEQGKVDEQVCQALAKAGDDAAAIAGSGIEALDSDWFPMAQHFSAVGFECQTAATADLDSAWDSMTNELQLAVKDLVAFKAELAKTLEVSKVDV